MSALKMTRAALLPAALFAFLGSGCAKKADKDGVAADSSAMDTTAITTPAAPAAPQYSDAEIAHIAVTANSVDSTAGVQALKKATNTEVKSFARTMIRDHGAANKLATALATKLSLTPQDNDQSRALETGYDQSQAELNAPTLTGAAFDKAYIDHEVAYHQAVLDALDKVLIPQSDNAELKALLEQIRPNVAQHLQMAQKIQSTLATTS
jgi:putative membrane protein